MKRRCRPCGGSGFRVVLGARGRRVRSVCRPCKGEGWVEQEPETVRMNAITIWQPWAHAIAFGPKRVENRTWTPPDRCVGEPLLIHAAKRKPRGEDLEDVRRLWQMMPGEFPLGVVVGVCRLRGVTERRLRDPWAHGPVCWLLQDREPLLRPVPARGRQQVWSLDVPIDALPERWRP